MDPYRYYRFPINANIVFEISNRSPSFSPGQIRNPGNKIAKPY